MKNKLVFLFLLIQLTVAAQTDSTDIIVQRIMKEQRITGMSLAVVKKDRKAHV